MHELIRLEFLYEQVEAEEPVYLFKHVLTQESAYLSLPLARRQPLHAAAGRALEAFHADRPDEVVDRLAYHYARSTEPEKAITYLTRCAAKAARSGAHVEAVASLQDALLHVEHCPPTERNRRFLDLTLHQALSLSVLGRFQQILELLQPQQELIEQLQEPALTGPYYLRLGMTLYYLGDREQAVLNAHHALKAAQHCRDRTTMGVAYNVLALECSLAGRYQQGIAYGQRAVALLHPTEEQDWLGEAHWIVGSSAAGLGDFEAALEAFARTRTLGETLENLRLQCLADSAVGWIYTMRGEWEAGITACQRSLDRSPDPINTALALGFLGLA